MSKSSERQLTSRVLDTIAMLRERIDTHPVVLRCLHCKLDHVVTNRVLAIKCAACRKVTLYSDLVLFFMWCSVTWVLHSRWEAHFDPQHEALRYATPGPDVPDRGFTHLTTSDGSFNLTALPWSQPYDERVAFWRRVQR